MTPITFKQARAWYAGGMLLMLHEFDLYSAILLHSTFIINTSSSAPKTPNTKIPQTDIYFKQSSPQTFTNQTSTKNYPNQIKKCLDT